MLLTPENYQKGFLVDDQLMAGISESPDNPGVFVAYVLDHESGEYLGYEPYPTLDGALAALNQIPRTWAYESVGCQGCKNNEGGGRCKIGGCGKKNAKGDDARGCC